MKVRVRFTDDTGSPEGPLVSAATPIIPSLSGCPAPTWTGRAIIPTGAQNPTLGAMRNTLSSNHGYPNARVGALDTLSEGARRR